MTARRGLTLVEVLASTVLLTLIAATCVPVLRQAMDAAREPTRSIDLVDLAELADQLAGDPDALGPLGAEGQLELPWPDQPDHPAVLISRLESAGGDEVDHAWLTFNCDGWSVTRWIVIESDAAPEDADQQGSPP